MRVARESVQETLGFISFELVFSHVVCGPLKMLKESWLAVDIDDDQLNHYLGASSLLPQVKLVKYPQ